MTQSSPTALVTGGSRGIGAAVVAKLKHDGFTVIAPTRAELDLAELASVEEFARLNATLAPDVLILNAGENYPELLKDVSTDHWLRTMNVNLNSAFVLLRVFAQQMRPRRGGRITAISSCYSLRGREGRGPYSASKAALNSLIRTAALEYSSDGLLVNAVAPGFVLTDLTEQNNTDSDIKELEKKIPLGRLATPQEIANLVSFLSSPANSYITGQLIAIDGGFLAQ